MTTSPSNVAPGGAPGDGGPLDRAWPALRVDLDAIARLSPDLVLAPAPEPGWAPRSAEPDAALREAFPGRPRVLALGADTLADVWRVVRRVSEALGVPERGVQVVSRQQRRMRAIADRASALPRLRVACLGSVEPLEAAGGWIPELLALAGTDDVLGGAAFDAGARTVETLAAADPDAVFVVLRDLDTTRARAAMPALEGLDAWRGLRAVRERRVFLGDGNALFDRPGPRVAEALEALAEALHPHAFRFGREGRGWERLAGAGAGSAPLSPARGARSAR